MSNLTIHIEVNRKDIFSKNVGVFTDRIANLRRMPSTPTHLSKLLRGTVFLTVAGYDDDPRELYEIKEVREWFGELLKVCPHLFYFIDPRPSQTYKQYTLLLPMYVKYEIENRAIRFDLEDLTQFILRQLRSVVDFAKSIGDDPVVAKTTLASAFGLPLLSNAAMSGLIQSIEIAPTVVFKTPIEVRTAFSAEIQVSWAGSIGLDSSSLGFRGQLSAAVSEGRSVVVEVSDLSLVASFLPFMRYAGRGENLMQLVDKSTGYQPTHPKFRLCCVLSTGKADFWPRDSSSKDYWLVKYFEPLSER